VVLARADDHQPGTQVIGKRGPGLQEQVEPFPADIDAPVIDGDEAVCRQAERGASLPAVGCLLFVRIDRIVDIGNLQADGRIGVRKPFAFRCRGDNQALACAKRCLSGNSFKP
jgi:hypothetical protein